MERKKRRLESKELTGDMVFNDLCEALSVQNVLLRNGYSVTLTRYERPEIVESESTDQLKKTHVCLTYSKLLMIEYEE